MRIRSAFVAAAAGAIVLGLLAPAAASAAPTPSAAPTASAPSGKALVRVDGGTAYAKKTGKGQYRIVVPDGASIEWLGEVQGKGVRKGNFSAKALVAGWAKLGHSDNSKPFTTLTWVEAGAKLPTFRAAKLWKPRINSDGQLTFLAKAKGLPQEMVDFSINITRASKATRDAYPIDGDPFYVDDTHYLLVVLTAAVLGYIEWHQDGGSRAGSCAPDTNLPGPGVVNLAKKIVCGDMTVGTTMSDGTQSFVQVVEQANGGPSQVNMGASYSFDGNIFFDFLVILHQASGK